MAADPHPTPTAAAAESRWTGRRVALILAGIWLGHLCLNVLYIGQDRSIPQQADASNHLDHVYTIISGLEHQGAGALLAEVRRAPHEWPPLVYLVGGVLGALGPSSPQALRLQNMLYLALLLGAVYYIGRRCLDPGAGLLAAAVCSLLPGIYGPARQFGLDFPAAAMTALVVAALLATRELRRPGPSALLGLVAGLALLTRGQTLFFFLPPALVVLGRVLVQRRWRGLAHAALALGLALGVSAPWWFGRLGDLLQILEVHASADKLPLEGPPGIAGGLALYLGGMPGLLSLPLALLVLGLLPLWARGPARHRLELAAWLVLPLAVHVALAVRNPRYLLPLLPALALVAALGAHSLRRDRPRRWATRGTLLLATLLWLACFTPLVRGSPETCSHLFCGHHMINAEQSRSSTPEGARLIILKLSAAHPRGQGLALRPLLADDRPADNLLLDLLLLVRARLPLAVEWRDDAIAPAPWMRAALTRARATYVVCRGDRPPLAEARRLVLRWQPAEQEAVVSLWQTAPSYRWSEPRP